MASVCSKFKWEYSCTCPTNPQVDNHEFPRTFLCFVHSPLFYLMQDNKCFLFFIVFNLVPHNH